MNTRAEQASGDLLEFVAAIVSAYVARNPIPPTEIAALIKNIHAALTGLANGQANDTGNIQKPAVAIKKSITPDYLVCLEDGKKLKMLKRYLNSRYSLSPVEYRAKWGLPVDYPMIAPNYAELRSQFAKSIGLGRTPKKVAPTKRKRA